MESQFFPGPIWMARRTIAAKGAQPPQLEYNYTVQSWPAPLWQKSEDLKWKFLPPLFLLADNHISVCNPQFTADASAFRLWADRIPF